MRHTIQRLFPCGDDVTEILHYDLLYYSYYRAAWVTVNNVPSCQISGAPGFILFTIVTV